LAVGVALALVGAAHAATIRGTASANLIHGTANADRILAAAGNDRVVGQLGGRDTISCGAGSDVVSADLSDAVNRDCEAVSRQLARDPFRNPEAQHETQVEPDSFAFGSTVVAAYQTGRFEDGGADATGFSTSRDGGRTWRSGQLPGVTVSTNPPGTFDRASDPSVAYDAQHGVWLVTSLVLTLPQASGIVVSRSRDGLAWDPAVTVGQAPGPLAFDKEWIVCDNGERSPFRGTCYVTYSDIATLQLATQYSRDGGLTWSVPVYPPDAAGRAGIEGPLAPAPQPLVLPNGDLVIPILDGLDMVSLRSRDGGASFERAVPITRLQVPPAASFRAPPLPSAEVDAAGRITLAWPDCRFRPICRTDDIVFSQSTDGVTWTPPARVPIDGLGSGIEHTLPGVAADPARPGRLGLVYYNVRNGSLDVGFVSSNDGGATWSVPVRLSPESMPLTWLARAGGRFVGDYVSTSFAGQSAIAIFVLATKPGALLHEAVFASRRQVP
jgi:hypothetical protein